MPTWQTLQLRLKQVTGSRFTKFTLVGILLTVGGAVFIGWAPALGLTTGAANFIQAIASVILNLVFSYLFTWGDRRNQRLRSIIGRFTLAKCVTIPLNQVIFQISESVFGFFFPVPILGVISDWLVAYCVSTGVIMLVNFRLMDRFVFGKGSLRVDAGLTLKMWKRPRK